MITLISTLTFFEWLRSLLTLISPLRQHGTTVPYEPSTERLLRKILNLAPSQQLEICTRLTSHQSPLARL